jgi:hypothetical protein
MIYHLYLKITMRYWRCQGKGVIPLYQEGAGVCSLLWKRPTVGALSRGKGRFLKNHKRRQMSLNNYKTQL